MEDIRGIQHPLQTPLVLDCIFKSLGVPDLKACREVCRAWQEEATQIMRPLVQVDIQSHEDGVTDFLQLVQSEASTFSESPFVNNFRIMNFNYAEDGPEFWDFCGKNIKSLHLVDSSFETDDEFSFAVFQSCSNLEELYLQNVDVNPEGNVGDEPVIWMPPRFPQNRNLKSLEVVRTLINGRTRMEILSHFPCLEKLKFDDTDVNVDWVFRSLTTLRERDNEGWPLKSVGVDFSHLQEPLAILPVLVEGNLTLEEFNAFGIAGPAHGIVVRGILEAHAESLKKLRLATWRYMVMAVPLPNNKRFEKLESLDLIGVDLSLTNLLRNVPNLRRLVIFSSRAVQPEDPNDDWVLPSCTELNLHDDELEVGNLQGLLRRLPNLEKLVMGKCDNDLFAVICELCPKLTFLNLWRCEVDDCGISGLDIEDVVRINQEGANGWTWWRPITVGRPNLSSLKSLKWLRLFPRVAAKSPGFCAALCGVQQQSNLRHLCLGNSLARQPIWKLLMDQYPWVDQ